MIWVLVMLAPSLAVAVIAVLSYRSAVRLEERQEAADRDRHRRGMDALARAADGGGR